MPYFMMGYHQNIHAHGEIDGYGGYQSADWIERSGRKELNLYADSMSELSYKMQEVEKMFEGTQVELGDILNIDFVDGRYSGEIKPLYPWVPVEGHDFKVVTIDEVNALPQGYARIMNGIDYIRENLANEEVGKALERRIEIDKKDWSPNSGKEDKHKDINHDNPDR